MDYSVYQKAAIRAQDVIEICPYDPAHLIGRSRMQYHLVKCSKQHASKEFETCPFNTTHKVPKPELAFHVSICRDRRIIEMDKFRVESTAPSKVKPRVYEMPSLPPCEENWDDDDLQSSYEPQKYVSDKLVLRNLIGATKSERKRFRMEERRRVNQIVAQGNERAPEPVKVDGPLRLPRSLPKEMKPLEMNSRLGMGRGVVSYSSVGHPGSSKMDEMVKGRGAMPRK